MSSMSINGKARSNLVNASYEFIGAPPNGLIFKINSNRHTNVLNKLHAVWVFIAGILQMRAAKMRLDLHKID